MNRSSRISGFTCQHAFILVSHVFHIYRKNVKEPYFIFQIDSGISQGVKNVKLGASGRKICEFVCEFGRLWVRLIHIRVQDRKNRTAQTVEL